MAGWAECFVMGYLVSSFMGMIQAIPLLQSEVFDPVFEGKKRVEVITLSVFMIISWWGGLIWLISKFV